MHTFDLRFLNNLKQQLSTGNRSSIQLNALPGRYLSRMDLADLNKLEDGASEAFLEILLSVPEFEFKLDTRPSKAANPEELKKHEALVKRLSTITAENKSQFKEHGTETFGLGFPVLLMQDPKSPTHIFKAPLFIWSLNIERNPRRQHEWIIRRKIDYGVTHNTLLAAQVYQQLGMKLYGIEDQFMDDGVFDTTELVGLVFKQLKQLNPNIEESIRPLFHQKLKQPIAPLLTREAIGQYPLEQPKVIWSGIFGLFKSQKESIINDIDELIEEVEPFQQKMKEKVAETGEEQNVQHPFSSVPLDPSQQHLLNSLTKGKSLIIQGPPGTGKSQTLTGIITNALANKSTCLIVCEKKTALDVIYENLEAVGLEELAVIVEDIFRDRKTVVESVRNRNKIKNSLHVPSANFQRLIRTCTKNIQSLQGMHEQLVASLVNDETWTDLVGTFLNKKLHPALNQIEKHLKNDEVKYTVSEYEGILDVLEEAQEKFKHVGTLEHPLNVLQDHFFEDKNYEQSENRIKRSIKQLIQVVELAQRDILSYLFEYEKLIEEHFSKLYLLKSKFTSSISELIEEGFEQSDYYFSQNTGWTRSLLRGVSKKYKKLEADKIKILHEYAQLIVLHKKYEYFQFKFVSCSDPKKVDYEALAKHIKEYQFQVFEWYNSRSQMISKVVRDLSPENIYKHIIFKTEAETLIRHLNRFEEDFRNSKVLKLEFTFSNRVIRERLTTIEDLHADLKKLQNTFNDFENYYALKYLWVRSNDVQKNVIRGFSKTQNIEDWTDCFSSWYLKNCLIFFQSNGVPTQIDYERQRDAYLENDAKVKELLHNDILGYWRAAQTESVTSFHKTNKPLKLNSLYNIRGGAGGRRTALRQIVKTAPELFQTFFPVLLVSPAVCSSILPLELDLYDLVIFDEASQLRIEDNFCALIRGKRKVISGDSQQMPPSSYFGSTQLLLNDDDDLDITEADDADQMMVNESIDYLSSAESLLEYTLAEGYYSESFLEIHYRSKHPSLIDFSNAAFYGNRLSPMPPTADYKPIHFYPINGRYDKQQNLDEANAILDYLFKLVLKLPKGENCPSVGIATFNLPQRNLILDCIRERSAKETEQDEAFQCLYNAGLFVKNLENIQGDERDIILLSTTYGPRDDKGTFTQNFGPINRAQGHRLLNVIVTRAKQEMHVFTSVPEAYYTRYRAEIEAKGPVRKGIFYAYLQYAKVTSENLEKQRAALLDFLADVCTNKPARKIEKRFNSDAFKEYVIKYLSTILPEQAYKMHYTYGGFKIPIMLFSPDGKPTLALYFDLYHEQYSEEAYLWDQFYEQHLSRLDIPVHRVWSKEWFRDLGTATSKLEKQINTVVKLY